MIFWLLFHIFLSDFCYFLASTHFRVVWSSLSSLFWCIKLVAYLKSFLFLSVGIYHYKHLHRIAFVHEAFFSLLLLLKFSLCLCNVVNRIFVPWWILSSDCCAPSFPNLFSYEDHLIIWMWWERNGPFGQRPAQHRKPEILTHTLFPPVEKLQSEWVSLGIELCHFRGGVTQIIETVPFTHFNAPTLGSFCSSGVLKLLLDSQTSAKMLWSVGDCQNWCSLPERIETCILASCWCHSILF